MNPPSQTELTKPLKFTQIESSIGAKFPPNSVLVI